MTPTELKAKRALLGLTQEEREMTTLASFTKGQPVIYSPKTTIHPDYIGKSATVIRPVKSRNVVTIQWDHDGKWFDANPLNLQIA